MDPPGRGARGAGASIGNQLITARAAAKTASAATTALAREPDGAVDADGEGDAGDRERERRDAVARAERRDPVLADGVADRREPGRREVQVAEARHDRRERCEGDHAGGVIDALGNLRTAQPSAIFRRSSASLERSPRSTPISRATSRSARPERVASCTISVARS